MGQLALVCSLHGAPKYSILNTEYEIYREMETDVGLVQVSNGHCNTWDHVTRAFPYLSEGTQ